MSLSFKPELMVKVLAGEKTVTRRELPTNYKAGQEVAIVPGMGRISCGKVRILDVQEVPFHSILREGEPQLEGFIGANAFMNYWQQHINKKLPDKDDLVARIEFELIEVKRTICKCCAGVGTEAATNG